MTTNQALIIQYTNLLHQYRDPKAKEVRDFVKKNEKDSVFVKRAAVLDRMFVLKNQLVK